MVENKGLGAWDLHFGFKILNLESLCILHDSLLETITKSANINILKYRLDIFSFNAILISVSHEN